jgi:hypothetical protein
VFLTPGIWYCPDVPHTCNAYCGGDLHATVVELHRTADAPIDEATLRHDIGLTLAQERVVHVGVAPEAHHRKWHAGDVCRSYLVVFEPPMVRATDAPSEIQPGDGSKT